MKRVSFKGIIFPLLLAVVGASIAVGAYVTTTGGSFFELRKKAAETKGSQLVFTAPRQVEVGKPFTVELVLDTTGDPNYTISGVDAVVGWSVDGLATIQGGPGIPPPSQKFLPNASPIQLLSVANGTIFDSYPSNQKNYPRPGPVPCGGIQGLSCPTGETCVYDNGSTRAPNPDAAGNCVPQFSIEGTQNNKLGQGGSSSANVSTTTTTESSGQSQIAVCPPFPGCDAINNWQLGMAFPACWGDALTKCPAPTSKPRSDSSPLTISGVKNYAVDEKGYFKGFSGKGVFATLTFVAQNPGKVSINLVYKDPSTTDDTNINGFLASQPVSLQKPQERLLVAPQTFSVEVVAFQPTPTTTPAPTCVPPPNCIEGEPKNDGRIYCALMGAPIPGTVYCPKASPTPKPTCTPLPPCAYEGVPDQNDPNKRVFCAVDLLPGAWSCPRPTPTPTPRPTPTPTPTPEPRVMINFRLQLEGRKSHATVVDIYGMTTTTVQPNSKVLELLSQSGSDAIRPGNRFDKLGTAITDPSGTGTLSLDRTYAGATYVLFAQTPSHLRKAVQNYQTIRLDVGQNPVCRAQICTQEVKYVDFGTLTAGDVYVDEKGNKDNLINTFDVGAVYAAWSGASVVGREQRPTFLPEMPVPADLNGDGVVNNRDLAMLLANFNKRGDTSILPRPLPVITGAPQ